MTRSGASVPAGRPRKPAALRILEGNRGNRRIPDEPQIADEGIPKRPAHLQGLARTQWDSLAEKLHAAGLLTSVDSDALAAYCVSYAEWRDCCAIIKREGRSFVTSRGVRGIRPEVKIAHKALALMQQLMAQFGLSPKARANLGGPVGKKGEEDPFNAATGRTA